METMEKILGEFVEAGKQGDLMEEEYFKNRQPKGYQHLPWLVDDLREMSNLLPTQTHDSSDQDERPLLQGLLQP